MHAVIRATFRAVLLTAIVICAARAGYERGAFDAGRAGYLDGYKAAADSVIAAGCEKTATPIQSGPVGHMQR